ncbi:unnamed protein product [Rotaria magnacalcarata]|uniref:Uncharacterized protein n=1 Tax=Rotaria magnacalcarata TaxID=392030 RepID=A0A820JQ94_9BILA|nr:unnamed protein product [Rotaria magnacalcarata]
MRQDTINVHQNYSIKPKADCITEAVSNFNLDYSLINKAEILNNSEINKTVSEFEGQYKNTIVIADLFRDNKATEVDNLFSDTEPKAEIVKLTEAVIIIKLNKNIELIVPNNNTEPIIDNVIVELPDIELVRPENIKINLEKSLIEPKASQNFNLEYYKNANEINILGNNIGPKAKNFKQTEAIVSVKLDEGCKIINTNNNIKPPASIIVESDKGKGKVNNINSNLQPKARSIGESKSYLKSNSNKNVNLNLSKLVIKPKATDVNSKLKLIVHDNKKVKLDVKNNKLKPKAKGLQINEIIKVKTTDEEVEPKAESLEEILAEFNFQYNKDNGIKITNDKVEPKVVNVVKYSSKFNISPDRISRVDY